MWIHSWLDHPSPSPLVFHMSWSVDVQICDTQSANTIPPPLPQPFLGLCSQWLLTQTHLELWVLFSSHALDEAD